MVIIQTTQEVKTLFLCSIQKLFKLTFNKLIIFLTLFLFSCSGYLIQAEEMYKNHLITMNELLMQQANAQKAEAEAILSKYEETIAAAKLKLSIGKSLKDSK